METASERKIPVYKLLNYKRQLQQLYSFSASIDRCNFTIYKGWQGKFYVNDDGHGVEEYKPSLRGVTLLDVNYLKLTDYVVLTDEQYKDYVIISGTD